MTVLSRRGHGHRQGGFVLAPVVVVPSGNVRVTEVAGCEPLPRAQVSDPAAESVLGWSVRDGNGAVVLAEAPSRAAAVRQLGALALHGAALPLVVHDPEGAPTGEHLA